MVEDYIHSLHQSHSNQVRNLLNPPLTTPESTPSTEDLIHFLKNVQQATSSLQSVCINCI